MGKSLVSAIEKKLKNFEIGVKKYLYFLGSDEESDLFLDAVRGGDYDVVQRFIKDYPNVINAKTFHGGTALHIAASNGDKVIAKLLIESNIDVNGVNKAGYTALHIAKANGDQEMSDLLVRSGINTEIDGNDGKKAGDIVPLSGNMLIYKKLLAHNGDKYLTEANDPSRKGKVLSSVVKAGDHYKLEVLIQMGLVKDQHNSNTSGLINIAVKKQDYWMVKVLADNGLDVNTHNKDVIPLHIAVNHNDYSMVTLLIAKGAKIDEKDAKGMTAIHKAALKGNEEIARFLVEKGASIDVKNNDGETPYDLMVKKEMLMLNRDLADFLKPKELYVQKVPVIAEDHDGLPLVEHANNESDGNN